MSSPAVKHRSRKPPKETNVQVVVRSRPMSAKEQEKNAKKIVKTDPVRKEVKVREKNQEKVFTFDSVFSSTASQADVYAGTVAPIVEEVLLGFNCTVFAYGQTGTGKTYTMEGNFIEDEKCGEGAGLLPRAVNDIFAALEKVREFSVKVSYLELYNEELTDLMTDDSRLLRLFEDNRKGTQVNNLEEVHVDSAEDVLNIARKCVEKRRTAETLLNKHSSRSHTIFTITIYSKDSNEIGEDVIRTGKLHLVDLAGSECIGRSGATEERAKEAGQINRSLLTLGRVITALVENHSYVPYRDSKLTRLLKESLGGSSKTCIIATVSPAENCQEETMSTLNYANRAKFIKNKPEINQRMTHKAYMNELLEQINALKKENDAIRQKNGVYVNPDDYDEMKHNLRKQKEQLEEAEMKFMSLKKEYDELDANFTLQTDELNTVKQLKEEIENNLQLTQQMLEQTKEELADTLKRLKEEKFIVSAYKEGEQILHSQAEQLTQALKEAIQDNSNLHNSNDRRMELEQTNLKAASVFNTDVDASIDRTQSAFKSFQSTQIDSLGKIESQVNTFVAQSQKNMATMVNTLHANTHSMNEIIGLLASTMQRQEETVMNESAGRNELLVKQQANFANRLKEFNNKHLQATASLTECIFNQHKAVMAWAMQIRAETEQALQKQTQFFSEQTANLMHLKNYLNQHSQSNVAQVEARSSELNDLKQSIEIQLKESMQQTMAQLQSIMLAQFSNAQSHMFSQINSIQGKMQVDCDTIRTQNADATALNQSIIQKQTDFRSACDDTARQQAEQMQAFNEEREVALNGVNAQLQHLSQLTDNDTNELHSSSSAALTEQINLTESELKQFRSFADEIHSQTKQQQDHSASNEQFFSSSFARQSQQANQLGKCTRELIEEANSLLQSSGVEFNGTVDELTSRKQSYLEHDIQKYKRSGLTPEKKQHSYPVDIHRTADDANLIARFREQMAALEEEEAQRMVEETKQEVEEEKETVEETNEVEAVEEESNLPEEESPTESENDNRSNEVPAEPVKAKIASRIPTKKPSHSKIPSIIR